MTEQKHTPEPWHAPGIGEVCDESGRCIGIMIDYANARRVAACVNACAGIRTEALERRVHMLQAGDDEIASLRQQRDQLRAALEAMLEIHGVTQKYADTHIYIPQSWVEVSDIARAALAATEGS